jgi:hypothetical protein
MKGNGSWKWQGGGRRQRVYLSMYRNWKHVFPFQFQHSRLHSDSLNFTLLYFVNQRNYKTSNAVTHRNPYALLVQHKRNNFTSDKKKEGMGYLSVYAIASRSSPASYACICNGQRSSELFCVHCSRLDSESTERFLSFLSQHYNFFRYRHRISHPFPPLFLFPLAQGRSHRKVIGQHVIPNAVAQSSRWCEACSLFHCYKTKGYSLTVSRSVPFSIIGQSLEVWTWP